MCLFGSVFFFLKQETSFARNLGGWVLLANLQSQINLPNSNTGWRQREAFLMLPHHPLGQHVGGGIMPIRTQLCNMLLQGEKTYWNLGPGHGTADPRPNHHRTSVHKAGTCGVGSTSSGACSCSMWESPSCMLECYCMSLGPSRTQERCGLTRSPIRLGFHPQW